MLEVRILIAVEEVKSIKPMLSNESLLVFSLPSKGDVLSQLQLQFDFSNIPIKIHTTEGKKDKVNR